MEGALGTCRGGDPGVRPSGPMSPRRSRSIKIAFRGQSCIWWGGHYCQFTNISPGGSIGQALPPCWLIPRLCCLSVPTVIYTSVWEGAPHPHYRSLRLQLSVYHPCTTCPISSCRSSWSFMGLIQPDQSGQKDLRGAPGVATRQRTCDA